VYDAGVSVERDHVLALVLEEATARLDSIHGLEHWARVERNGLWLARQTGADSWLITLFALFHDAMRVNDHHDPDHGPRAADLAAGIGHEALGISPEQLEVLCRACRGHTRELHSEDPAVATCWDADRLDLPRAGITPKPRFFSTVLGRELARSGDLSPLESIPVERYEQTGSGTGNPAGKGLRPTGGAIWRRRRNR